MKLDPLCDDGMPEKLAVSPSWTSRFRIVPVAVASASSPSEGFVSVSVSVSSLSSSLSSVVGTALIVLIAAAGLVLLIACANVANLLLAQAAAREREVVARLVLGASRGRLLRQSMIESLCLALLGGGVGIGLAHAGVRLLPTIATSLSRRDLDSAVILPQLDEVGIDGSVLLFTVVVSVLTGVLFGVVPALRRARTGSVDVLRQGGGSAASGFDVRGRSRAQGLLVACEIGVALVLCVGSALLIRSFVELADVDRGYDAERVVTFQLVVPAGRNLVDVSEMLADRVQSLPGVLGAAYTRQLLMVRARSLVPLRTTPRLPAEPAPPPAPSGVVNPPEWPDTRHVSHDYPDVIGIDVVAGRGFDEGDGPGRQVGPDPVGRHVYALGLLPWEVVGVIEDVHQSGLDHAPGPQVFLDLGQLPFAARRIDVTPLDARPERRVHRVGGCPGPGRLGRRDTLAPGTAVRARPARRPDLRGRHDRPGRHRGIGIVSAGPSRRAGGSVERDSLRIGRGSVNPPANADAADTRIASRADTSTSYAVSNARSIATEMRFQLRVSASN